MSGPPTDVCVFVDHMDGRSMPVSFELLAEARRIADGSSGRVVAVVFGLEEEAVLKQLAEHRADRICIFATADPNGYDPDVYGASLGALLADEGPLLCLFPATSRGHDLAGRIAALRGWPLFPRVVNMRLRDGGLEVTRALAGGGIHAQLTPATAGPCIVTIGADVLGAADPSPGRAAVVDRKELVVPEERFIEACGVMKSDPATIDLSEAEIVVSVGRGMGSAENVRLAHQLAEALGGVLAGTRVAVDLGWLPKARQVGQTGKTIQPRLYIACGLSGATQHTMGMKQSDNIIAINIDPVAPIFKIADLSIGADAVELLPFLAEKCRLARGDNSE